MLICRLVFQGPTCKRGATPENSKSNNSSKFHATITNAPKQPWFHHIGPLLKKVLENIDYYQHLCMQSAHVFIVPS